MKNLQHSHPQFHSAFGALLSVTLLASIAMMQIAHADTLSGSEIKSAVSNKTVTLKTRWGGFPLRYNASGTLIGDGSALGLGKFFAPKETGTWWVTNGKLCQQFPTWYKGKRSCFILERTGLQSLKWKRDDGATGTATIAN